MPPATAAEWSLIICTSIYTFSNESEIPYILYGIYLLLSIGVLIGIKIRACKIFHTGETEFDLEKYAQLKAEKDEFTIIAGGVSLGGIITQLWTLNKEKLGLLAISLLFILLCGIAYRRIVYAIYVQEYYKQKEQEKKQFCPLIQNPEKLIAALNDKGQAPSTSNSIQITCNTRPCLKIDNHLYLSKIMHAAM